MAQGNKQGGRRAGKTR